MKVAKGQLKAQATKCQQKAANLQLEAKSKKKLKSENGKILAKH